SVTAGRRRRRPAPAVAASVSRHRYLDPEERVDVRVLRGDRTGGPDADLVTRDGVRHDLDRQRRDRGHEDPGGLGVGRTEVRVATQVVLPDLVGLDHVAVQILARSVAVYRHARHAVAVDGVALDEVVVGRAARQAGGDDHPGTGTVDPVAAD